MLKKRKDIKGKSGTHFKEGYAQHSEPRVSTPPRQVLFEDPRESQPRYREFVQRNGRRCLGMWNLLEQMPSPKRTDVLRRYNIDPRKTNFAQSPILAFIKDAKPTQSYPMGMWINMVHGWFKGESEQSGAACSILCDGSLRLDDAETNPLVRYGMIQDAQDYFRTIL